MVRVLTFGDGDPKGEKRFELVLTALYNAGDKTGKRDFDILRKEARLFKALKAISEPLMDRTVTQCANCGCILEARHQGMPTTRDQRVLKAGDQQLVLQSEDYKLLDQYIEKTPWLPSSAEDAVDMYDDWFSAAEKRD